MYGRNTLLFLLYFAKIESDLKMSLDRHIYNNNGIVWSL